jgi:ABC-type uncharacterized transport system substrate-binding protein
MSILGGVLVLAMLFLWAIRLHPEPSTLRPEKSASPKEPTPDGSPISEAEVAVPYNHEHCVPWHVSAATPPPDNDTSFLFLSSKTMDPYGLLLAGFGKECGFGLRSLILENIKEGDLALAVSQSPPTAVVVVGRSALDLAHKEATKQALLYALIPNPSEIDFNSNSAGVLSFVPAAPMMRHLLKVLPKNSPLALFFASGTASEFVSTAADIAKREGHSVSFFEISPNANLDPILDDAARSARAWIVIPDRTLLDGAVFNRIQIKAEGARIPIVVSDEEHVRVGALAGVGPDTYRIGAQLCRLAGAMTRRQLPEGSHVFCPEYTFLVIHKAVAEKLGLMLDLPSLLQAKLYQWR